MSFQRLSERVEGKSRPPKVIPQSRTGGRETPITEFVMCSIAPVLAMDLCLCQSVCVCPSQVGVLSKRLNESSWFLARELPLTYLCYSEIQVPSKIRVLLSGTLLNFATAYRSSKRVINLARQRWTLRAC